MKDIYDDDFRYTDVALDLNEELIKLLKPVLDEWVDMGYSLRDIAHVMTGAV